MMRLIWKNTMKSSSMRHVHFLFYYDITLNFMLILKDDIWIFFYSQYEVDTKCVIYIVHTTKCLKMKSVVVKPTGCKTTEYQEYTCLAMRLLCSRIKPTGCKTTKYQKLGNCSMGKITSPFVWKIIVCSENLGEWKELDWLLTDWG